MEDYYNDNIVAKAFRLKEREEYVNTIAEIMEDKKLSKDEKQQRVIKATDEYRLLMEQYTKKDDSNLGLNK